MTTDIRPHVNEQGEPICAWRGCPSWSDCGRGVGCTRCGVLGSYMAHRDPCIPAIRQERDDARKALGWCLEGFEAEKCEGFYESPLYKKIERLLGDALIRKIQAAEAREEE